MKTRKQHAIVELDGDTLIITSRHKYGLEIGRIKITNGLSAVQRAFDSTSAGYDEGFLAKADATWIEF